MAQLEWTHEADYVIAGAGTAGCVLANRLSADGQHRVLLLEAGGGDAHPLVRMPVGFMKALQQPALGWGLSSEPEPHMNGRVLPVPRGRLLGGSSSINGMLHIRGHAEDFNDWARAGNLGWAYADVLPYFKRCESHALGAGSFHGGKGPLQVRGIDTRHLLAEPLFAAARQAGHAVNPDYDGAQRDGVAAGTVNIDAHGRRHSAARAYLHPVRARRNLSVLTRAPVQRVLFDEANPRRAIGVEFLQQGRLCRARAGREVLLAGGTYHSPQLLMLSGLGPGAELQALGINVRHDLPGVGGNLIEHPRMPLQFLAREPITFIKQLRFDRAVLSALRWAVLGSGPFATQICSGTVLLKSRPELDRPDIQLLCNPVRLDAALWFPGFKCAGPHSFYITVCQLYAKSRGRVSLRSSRADEAPRIAFNLFSHEDDFTSMRAGIRAARRIYQQPQLAALITEEVLPGSALQSDAQLDAAMAELGGITHHPVGTCAMGTGPLAVVDATLRVHGVQGLRVVDASVMPSMVGGNTNATVVMIGEKAADMILGDANV